MRRVLRGLLWSLLGLVALGAALFAYFVYAPAPGKPRLSGRLIREEVRVGGMNRSFLVYVPAHLAKDAPLVMVLHGSGQSGAVARVETGYGFDRLADIHGFAVAYPNGYEGYWNGCNIVGGYAANTRNIDDVAFLNAMTDKLARDIGIDRAKVFATGVSRGGHMVYRLALEAPQRFRAVAAVAASLPAPGNFKCKPAGGGTSAVMVMNGTADPLNPFAGGEVTLFGFVKRGTVLSSRATAEYFASANAIADKPATRIDGNAVRTLWHGKVDIELVAVQGGGHVMPQPYRRAPRILGTTFAQPDGPAAIWAFFERSLKGRP